MTAQRAHLDDRLSVVSGLAVAAGVIHIAAAIEHVDEYVLYAIFFALLAPAQLAWGAALYRFRGRHLLRLGAVANLLVVALWIVSRTSGVPIGPEPWTPEPVGLLDAVCSADEAVLALLAWLITMPRVTPLAHRAARFATLAGGLLVLTSALVLTGGHAH